MTIDRILTTGEDYVTIENNDPQDRSIRARFTKAVWRRTRMHLPKKLVHVEEYDSRAEAMKRERTIKKLNHNRKLELAQS